MPLPKALVKSLFQIPLESLSRTFQPFAKPLPKSFFEYALLNDFLPICFIKYYRLLQLVFYSRTLTFYPCTISSRALFLKRK